ncbi:MAG: DUF2207 domain-containing protein, partial [Actinomycetales bacterium]|nr:DUF2207 domain-containing protein [Actinomycetales bacterium]
MNNPILRFLARIGTLLLALGLILAPLLFGTLGSDSPSGSPEPVTITQYTSELAVDRNGELAATETITADFPNDRRGIFRYWDLTDPLDPKVRYEPKDIKVTMDGQYVPVEMSWERGRKLRVAKIGDPDQTLTPGEHTYVISFRVPGVISPEEEGSRFEWRAIADGWRMHIDRADIIVTLPHAPNNPVCRVGTNQECDQFEVAGNTLMATATNLAPNTEVRVASTFDEAAPAQTTAPWAIKYEPVLGKSAILVGFIALLTVAAVGVSHTIERLTRETAPGFPVMFDPPDGLGPVQTYFITHESVGKNALSATLMHLAERGAITLDRSKNKTWTIKGNWNDSKWSELDEVANAMGHALGIRSAGSIFRADGTENAGHALTLAEYGIEDAAQQWAQSSGLVESVKHETRYKYLITLCAVAALIPVFAPVMPTLWAAPFAAAVVGGIGIFGKGAGTRRTAFGRELWSR